jgi:uncharacterized lipoprotein YajG
VTAKTRNMKLLVLLLIIWLFAGCERSTHVTVEGGSTPVFSFTGSGNLANLEIKIAIDQHSAPLSRRDQRQIFE